MEAEPEQESESIQAFCKLLLQCVQLIRLYDSGNVVVQGPLQELQQVIRVHTNRSGAARLQAVEGVLYFNRDPVRGGRRTFTTVSTLLEVLEGLGIAEVAFTGAISGDHLQELFGLLRAETGEQFNLKAAQGALAAGRLKDLIQLLAPDEITTTAKQKEVDLDESCYFPLAQARTLILLREYVKSMEDVELNRYFTAKLHRAILELTRLLPTYGGNLLAMALIRNAGEEPYGKMASTGVLSLLLGYQLGVQRSKLSDLALAAMLHPIGMLEVEEPRLVSCPPTASNHALGKILAGRKVSIKTLTCALVVYQAAQAELGVVHPFVELVRVCEEFTALTSDTQRRSAYPYGSALRDMDESKRYDATILAVLTTLVGCDPSQAGLDPASARAGRRFSYAALESKLEEKTAGKAGDPRAALFGWLWCAGRLPVPLGPQAVLRIGRGSANDLAVPDNTVSRKQSLVMIDGDTVFMEDVSAVNPTQVNGEPIKTRVELKVGDVIKMGSYRIEIRAPDAVAIPEGASLAELLGQEVAEETRPALMNGEPTSEHETVQPQELELALAEALNMAAPPSEEGPPGELQSLEAFVARHAQEELASLCEAYQGAFLVVRGLTPQPQLVILTLEQGQASLRSPDGKSEALIRRHPALNGWIVRSESAEITLDRSPLNTGRLTLLRDRQEIVLGDGATCRFYTSDTFFEGLQASRSTRRLDPENL